MARLYRMLSACRRRMRAATGVEYALLVGLLALAALGATAMTGRELASVFCAVGADLQSAADDGDADCLSWDLDFALEDVTGATPGSAVPSGTVTPQGILQPLRIAVSGGGSALTRQGAATGERIAAGESFSLILQTADEELRTEQVSVTIGSLSRQWRVTTGCYAGRVPAPTDPSICTEASATEACTEGGVTGQRETGDGGASWSACVIPDFSVAAIAGHPPGQVANTGWIAPTGVLWTRTLAASGGGGPTVSSAEIDPGESFFVTAVPPNAELALTDVAIDLGGRVRSWQITTGCFASRIVDPEGSGVCVDIYRVRDCTAGGEPGRQASSDGGANWGACSVIDFTIANTLNVIPGELVTSGLIAPTGLVTAETVTATGATPSQAILLPGAPFTVSTTAPSQEQASIDIPVTVGNTQRLWHLTTACAADRAVGPEGTCRAQIETVACTQPGYTGTSSTYDAGFTWTPCQQVQVNTGNGTVTFGSITVYFSNNNGLAATTAQVQTGPGPVQVLVTMTNSNYPYRHGQVRMTVNSTTNFTVDAAPGYYPFMCVNHSINACQTGYGVDYTIDGNCLSPIRYTTDLGQHQSMSASRGFVSVGPGYQGRACPWQGY